MSEISLFLPTANSESALQIPQEENPQQKEKEKAKKKGHSNAVSKMGNSSNSKKLDTTLYKKIFFNNFKEVCNQLFPQHKNFSNEKYQNFKNIYHKIYFYKRKFEENFIEFVDDYSSKTKKINEIKKTNHKNRVIKLLIQKIEEQPTKPKENNVFKQIAEEIGRDIKAEFIEKIYDSVDITEIKDFDKDKTLDNFFQRHQEKEIHKKRTRKQLDKPLLSSAEKLEKSESSINTKKNPIKKQKYHSKAKPCKEEEKLQPMEEIKAQVEPLLDDCEKAKAFFEQSQSHAIVNNNLFNLQNSLNSLNSLSSMKQAKEKKNKDLSQSQYQSFWMNNNEMPKSQTPNLLDGYLNNDLLGENMDNAINEANPTKFTNRSILNKLNKFCSYDFTQTNALIPHICVSNEKKQQNSSMSTLKQTNPIIAQEFLKKMMQSSHESNNIKMFTEAEDLNSKNNFNLCNLSEDNYGGNLMSFQNNYPSFYSETHSIAPDTFINSYPQQRPNKIENNNGNFQDNFLQTSQQKTSAKVPILPNELTHNQILKNTNILNKTNKFSKMKSKKYSEKKAQHSQIKMPQSLPAQLLNNEKPAQNKLNVPIMKNPIVENKDSGILPKNLNFPSSNNFTNKNESSSFPQQFFNLMPLENKDMRNNNRKSLAPPLNISPQIYQTQYRTNAYFYNNNPQDNNYINSNNIISANNYCFPGNPNSYVGVNYPNLQNISFTKPNNYQTYGVMDMNGDAATSQYGINYMNDNRSYDEKPRNGEYWKQQQQFYPYNSQN